MKKEELIEELKKEIEATKNVLNCEEHFSLYAKGKRIGLEFGWMFAEKLDEPELPVIPHFVADWIEECKNNLSDLSFALVNWKHECNSRYFIDWFGTDGNEEVFARAWLDGYTIEKEKQYTVVFPSLTGTEEHFLVQGDNGIGGFWLDGDWDYIESSDMKALFTEQEIKAIDSRYWQFAEEVTND